MPSSGTKATGFCLAILGPFRCGNCQKMRGLCLDKEVYRDKEIPGYAERKSDAGIRVDPDECCNEFLSQNDKQRWDGVSRMNSGIQMGKLFKIE